MTEVASALRVGIRDPACQARRRSRESDWAAQHGDEAVTVRTGIELGRDFKTRSHCASVEGLENFGSLRRRRRDTQVSR